LTQNVVADAEGGAVEPPALGEDFATKLRDHPARLADDARDALESPIQLDRKHVLACLESW
jgi:hypothetical protein